MSCLLDIHLSTWPSAAIYTRIFEGFDSERTSKVLKWLWAEIVIVLVWLAISALAISRTCQTNLRPKFRVEIPRWLGWVAMSSKPMGKVDWTILWNTSARCCFFAFVLITALVKILVTLLGLLGIWLACDGHATQKVWLYICTLIRAAL